MPESTNIQEAMDRLKASVEYFDAQRKREKEDLAFQVPENQWDRNAALSREAVTIDGVPVPARPMISIPKLDQPIQLVLNQERAAHLGVQIHPVSEDATDETAEVLQGLYRAIERDSRANLARSWAFDRAVKAGVGAYRVVTEYDTQSPDPNDQKIVIKRILYQDSVYLDPSAQEPDWSDGEFAFITSWMTFDAYKRRYPKSQMAGFESGELPSLVEDAPEWVNLDGEKPAVLVAEYFRKAWPNGPDQPCVVLWSKINAVEELEPTQETNGQYIPIIPVIGKELQPFDATRRWVGIIGPSKGAARMFNYAASSALELAALEPKAPYQMYEGQQEGYEDMWQQANVRNFPYMLSKPVALPGGQVAPLPQRTQTDVSRLGPSMLLLDKADQFIQAATATFDPSLGNLPQKDRSGKAIVALQQQSDAGNSNYLQNLADISMTYEAKVVLDLIPAIYDRPGRVARILDGEDNSRAVILNAPFMADPKTRRPVPVPEGMGVGAPPPEQVKNYNLRTGTYGVAVSIGKSFQTRLQQGAETIGGILADNPQMLPLIGATYFKFRDEPGMKEIAQILKKVREKEYPGIDREDDAQGPPPEVLQQQIEQAKQMLEMAQQEIAALKQQAEMDAAKAQATLQKAEIDAASKLQVQAAKAANDERLLRMEQQFELMMTRLDQMFQAQQAERMADRQEDSAERDAARARAEAVESGEAA